MRRGVCILLSAAWLLADVAPARCAYVSLFADSTRRYNASCAFEGDRAVIDLYVVLYPGSNGMSGAHFRLIYPDNVTPMQPSVNDAVIDVWTGDLASGASVLFKGCCDSTAWCCRQYLFVETHEVTRIELEAYEASSCAPDFNRERLYVFWEHYVNYSPDSVLARRTCLPPPYVLTGAVESSWGAIKGLFR
ncbi:MAG: hypothetical protein JW876_10900 [Candidatus Krumholzibacteriota bacterium]|nr:hypothetical protein [Candidatus Krumholzibacteriota bacterium]